MQSLQLHFDQSLTNNSPETDSRTHQNKGAQKKNRKKSKGKNVNCCFFNIRRIIYTNLYAILTVSYTSCTLCNICFSIFETYFDNLND